MKSPPELWSELSEVERLAKHLGELGEIRITKVEPESTVAWEGDEVSGTVELEQSGWGTKVTFTATVPEPEAAVPEPEPAPEPAVPEPAPEPPEPEPAAFEPEPAAAEPAAAEPRRRRFLARWLFRQRGPAPEPVAAEPQPAAVEPAPVEPEPVPVEPEPVPVEPEPMPAAVEPAPATEPDPVAERVRQVFDSTLEALGQAHHRPFSRG